MQNQFLVMLNIYALVILTIICIVFFSKKRLGKFEDETYGKLLITCTLTVIVGVLSGIALIFPNLNQIISQFRKKCNKKVTITK